MASTFSSSPKSVLIEAVLEKNSKKYQVILPKMDLLLLNGARWHKLPILTAVVAKYFRFTFYESYGGENIAVRQIRLLRSKEGKILCFFTYLTSLSIAFICSVIVSARIEYETDHIIMKEGPIIGTSQTLTLQVKASGWPVPSYQWFRNMRPITGELRLISALKDLFLCVISDIV